MKDILQSDSIILLSDYKIFLKYSVDPYYFENNKKYFIDFYILHMSFLCVGLF